MKKLDIIYEVKYSSEHQGSKCGWSQFFRNRKKAMNFVYGLLEGTLEQYENEYKVQYSLDEKKIRSGVRDDIYIAEVVDTFYDTPLYTDSIIVTKRTLF